jgi:lipoic acid synthetase
LKNKPEWLRIRVRNNSKISQVEEILERFSLHTVCEEANCPNRMECFSRKTATFMILGRVCTRNCRFCNVEGGAPTPVDENEPYHVAEAVKELGLLHVVITSVTRDDLQDGGAGHFARTVEAVRNKCPGTIVEVLIPDFKGDKAALETVVKAAPDIINHNVETVPRLYSEIRPQARYERSLEVLKNVKSMDKKIYTKSGLMVGLGESVDEVLEVFKDLRDVGCDFLTVGQYLAPSKKHYPVKEYVHPDVFSEYKQKALDMGFSYVASSPLVRSSYNAKEALKGSNGSIDSEKAVR